MPKAILTYHSLDDSRSVLSLHPDLFRLQMQALASSGVKVASLPELRATPGPAVALTFDDGFANFAEVAAPLLASCGFPATLFLVTDHCGGYNDWPSQGRRIPRLPLLSWKDIAELGRQGIDFGAHTATHPDLARLDAAGAQEEILSSKQRIEEATGRGVFSFAYPYGNAPAHARRIVAQHFAAGCSSRLGWVTQDSKPEALERLDVYYLPRPFLFRRLFGPMARLYLALRGLLREWNRARHS